VFSEKVGTTSAKVVMMMMGKLVWLLTLLLILTLSVSITVVSASSSEINAFEKVINEIQLDKPVPVVNYLQLVPAFNKGEQRYEGTYQNWQIHVTVKRSSGEVISFGISRKGSDILEELLPVISTIYGNNPIYHESDGSKSLKSRGYGWIQGEFKSVNLFYQFGVVRFGGGYL